MKFSHVDEITGPQLLTHCDRLEEVTEFWRVLVVIVCLDDESSSNFHY